MNIAPWLATLAFVLLVIVTAVVGYLIGFRTASRRGEYLIRIERGMHKQFLVTISEEVVRTVNPDLPETVVAERAMNMLKEMTPPEGTDLNHFSKLDSTNLEITGSDSAKTTQMRR